MNSAKLRERLKSLQEKKKGGGGNKNFFKSPTDGSKAMIRQCPYPHNEDNMPFIEVGWHYNIAGHRSLVCPRETYNEPCPICELADEFKSMGGKDNWQIFKKLSAKMRIYSPVIVRGDEGSGVKLWGYGSTIYELLLEKYLDSEWGNLSDPMTGRDLKVWTIKAASKDEFDDPRMDVSPNVSKMMEKKVDIANILKEIPNFLEDGETFEAKSFTELKAIVAKFADPDGEQNNDFETPSSNKTSFDDDEDSSTDDESSLDQELENLLGNKKG